MKAWRFARFLELIFLVAVSSCGSDSQAPIEERIAGTWDFSVEISKTTCGEGVTPPEVGSYSTNLWVRREGIVVFSDPLGHTLDCQAVTRESSPDGVVLCSEAFTEQGLSVKVGIEADIWIEGSGGAACPASASHKCIVGTGFVTIKAEDGTTVCHVSFKLTGVRA